MEGYPFRQSWMTLTEPCVKARFVFACTVVSFTCQWYWWLPLYEAFSLYSLQQVTQLAKWKKKHQGDKMLLWSKNSSSKIYFVFFFAIQQKLSAQFLLLLCGNRWNISRRWDLECYRIWSPYYSTCKISNKFLYFLKLSET